MNKLFVLTIIIFIAGCATTNVMNENHIKDEKDIAEVEVFLSMDTRNFSENLYLRGDVICNDGSFAKLTGKTKEGKAILVATRHPFNEDSFIKIKLPANKPVGLRYLRHKVTEQHFTDFVVMLEANKTYQISDFNNTIQVVEKDSKKSALFLPNDFLHQQLKCK